MSQRSLQALCLMSFFLADVRDGLGPFLGIFLTERHWQADDIGLAMTAGGLAGLLVTIPAGVMIDATTRKRLWLLACCALITCATLWLWYRPEPIAVALSQIASGMAAAFIGPAVAGITLGIAGQSGFNRQTGRNEAFNHAGNMTAAVLAGLASWYIGMGAVFVLMTMMALLTAAAVLAIRERDIDHDVARGLASTQTSAPVPRLSVLARDPLLLLTGLTLLLFHLSNAALLPMLSMRVAAADSATVNPGLYAAATVIISQGVMIPVALFTAARIEHYGYRRLIMLALIVLPFRAAIAAGFSEPMAMIPVQIMDGLAAGILGVALPGYVVSVLKGSGHVNAGQSIIMFMQGVGASFSPALAGFIATRYSFSAAFTTMGVIALLAVALWWKSGREQIAA